MFQDVEAAINTLKVIRTYSEDLAELSSYLLKMLTDEEFADNNYNSEDVLNRKLIEEIISSKEGIIKYVNKLRRMVQWRC